MDKTRALPPLVRGRVSSVLEFFVDKVKFFRKILLLTDNVDLVLQVQWWGESLPALIRPKELQIQNRILKKSQSLKFSYHGQKYDIKTTLELFKSYLKTCEVLELSVLEAVKNYVIGSAFLRDLINLIKNNNELISMPIFDYLGEEIGEVIIHVNFLEKPQKKFKPKESAFIQISECDYLNKSPEQSCGVLSNLDDNFFSLREKTLFYDGGSNRRNEPGESLGGELGPQIDWFDGNQSERNLDLRFVNKTNKPLLNEEGSNFLCDKTKPFGDSFPNIETLSDSSKVLCFGLNSRQSAYKTDNKNLKIQVPNKFSSHSIKCKSKSKFSFNKNWQGRKISTIAPVASARNFPKKQTDVQKKRQFDNQLLPFEKSKDSEILPKYLHTNSQTCSFKEPSDGKVLDYLFGCSMSKDNEQRALNDLKKMSPSHNLVESISQLCLVSDSNSLASETKGGDARSSVGSKQTHLNFDFNYPIERDYYEKFFLKSNSRADFEVAEFLNHPENSVKLEKLKFNKAEGEEKSQVSSSKNHSNALSAGEEIKNSKNDNRLINDIILRDKTENCACCKYYKKLSELDTIIESLKHFEQKMILHEKNSFELINRNQVAEGS